jgi:hypothetical protein
MTLGLSAGAGLVWSSSLITIGNASCVLGRTGAARRGAVFSTDSRRSFKTRRQSKPLGKQSNVRNQTINARKEGLARMAHHSDSIACQLALATFTRNSCCARSQRQ